MGWFRVELDIAEAHPGTRQHRAYWHGMEHREEQLIYAALIGGYFNIEGGYPCMVCSRRHGPLAVFYNGQLVWTVAGHYPFPPFRRGDRARDPGGGG